MKIKVLELFAGIGACSKALSRLGIDHEIVDAVEVDKYAIKSFNAVHGTNFEPQDITKWDKDIDVDLIMHGSPCQDFSAAGLGKGGDKDSGTRSSLMYETLRIVEELKPKYVVWENVKNLLSQKHRHNFDAYIENMKQLGYVSSFKVLNAKDYGIPQNRERVFTVSIREDIWDKDYNNFNLFDFPKPIELRTKLKDVLEDSVDEKYYLSEDAVYKMRTSTFNQVRARENKKDVCGTICARDYKDPQCVRIIDDIYKNREPREYAETAPTLRHGRAGLKVAEPYRIRKLTPKECWRLMGFDDVDFEKAEKVNSNTQLYRQAGNSIVVNVLENIFKNLLVVANSQEKENEE